VRTLVAFFIASVTVAALAPFAIGVSLQPYPPVMLAWVIPVVCVFSALVALPIYFALPLRYQPQLAPLLLAGFVAAFLSFALFHFIFVHASFEQVGDTVYVRDGTRTRAGWILLLQQTALMGVAGTVGGFVFWAARRLTIVGGVRDAR
jgi:hypothetical protein